MRVEGAALGSFGDVLVMTGRDRLGGEAAIHGFFTTGGAAARELTYPRQRQAPERLRLLRASVLGP